MTDPGVTAMADQLTAIMRDEVPRLAQAIAEGDVLRGEAQNTADFMAFLTSRYSPDFLAALAITLLRSQGA